MGSKISREEHEEAMRCMNVYKDWFLDKVMQVGKKHSFVVMQSEDVIPRYRDDPPPSVSPPSFTLQSGAHISCRGYSIQPAWHQWWLSPILVAPEIVIPGDFISSTTFFRLAGINS